MKHNIKCKSDSEDIRIYIDDILHLRIPRDPNLKLHSWIEGNTKIYIIELWCAGHSEKMEYDNKKLWVDILNTLDKHI